MTAFALQVGGLMSVVFIVGCVAGCWLRRHLGTRA